MQKQLSGQKNQWTLLEQVGQGDAGEVFKACSTDHLIYAVLKRPSRNATGGSIIRQAVQIENEGRILAILDGIQIKKNKFTLLTPLLLDESDPKTSHTAKYFIVSQQAEGKSLTELLGEARKHKKTFSRELLLKVITSLFSLFENIHLKGILWNDVKADHIFWDGNSNSIMIIDWGNGVILENSRSNELWQLDFLDDYKQMMLEFSRIIASATPDLIWDLGWPQGQLQELDQNQVTLLKKRVEFADNYFNLRIVEYHARVKSLLNKADNLNAFFELIEYVNRLEQMGESVAYPQVLGAAKSLLLLNAKQSNIQECKSILNLVSKFPEENLEKEWAILYELFSIPEVTNHASFPIIVENACTQSWVNLFWELGQITAHKTAGSSWKRISRKVRNLVVPAEFSDVTVIEQIDEIRNDLHVKTIQCRILDDSYDELNDLIDLSHTLSDLVTQYEEGKSNKFFGEHLITIQEMLPSLNKFGVKVDPLIKGLLIYLQQITRQLISAWNSADFFLARQNLMTYFLWDPQFKTSPSLYASLLKMEEWVKSAYIGPGYSKDGFIFITEMLESLPDLHVPLGTPVWLQEITEGFKGILENKNKSGLESIQKKYKLPFSWLTDEMIMSQTLDQSMKFISLSNSQKEALEVFYNNLKTGVNDHKSLDLIKSELPRFAEVYETLAVAFNNLHFASVQQISFLENALIPAEDETNFLAAKQILIRLTNWVKAIREGSFKSALDLLPDNLEWTIVNFYHDVQNHWQNEFAPLLSDIKHKRWNQNIYVHNNGKVEDGHLKQCLNLLHETHQVWLDILEKGLNPKNVIVLIETSEQALQSYYKFMKSIEDLHEMKLFLSCFGDEINTFYRQIHQIVDQARTIQVAQEVLGRDEMLQTRIAYNSASDLMFSLTRLNDYMPANVYGKQVNDWMQIYRQVLVQGEVDDADLVISGIDPRHPLFNWFQSLSRT